MERKLPIGIQGFTGLRKDGYLYVDKTEYVHQLAKEGKYYFLSRPRRFGKSLLLSTIAAYWEGKKELFEGLKIIDLEKDNDKAWQPHPVLTFDFNGENYLRAGALEAILDEHLRRWEEEYNLEGDKVGSLGERFRNLLSFISQKKECRVVVLVDEYDKPLLDVVDQPDLRNHNMAVFKGFFSTLKSFDELLRFVFLTGVTKFHKVSIFSDLNQLKDISLTKQYASICGVTQEELDLYFQPEIRNLALEQGITQEECMSLLKGAYDGYRFHPDGSSVYNPYSLLNAFTDREFGSFWFETGTPTFLVKSLKEISFDLRKFTNHTIYADEAMLKDYAGNQGSPVPLLYQSGYLTIESYDKRRGRYTLAFPNEEVKYGFLQSLVPAYIPASTPGKGLDIFTLDEYVENGEVDRIRDVLTALFANITYTVQADPFEHYFQTVIFLVFTLLKKFAVCEMHTFTGRIDCKVETRNFIYLFEFKRDDTAMAALEQIDTKEYSLPFVADDRTLFKIGVSFDSNTRKLVGWEVR